MSMKRRTSGLLLILPLILIVSLCPSLCAYAAKYQSPSSHYYEEGIDDYADSYFNEGQPEDYNLIFFPPFPETPYKYYMLINSPENGKIYFLSLYKNTADFRHTAQPYVYDLNIHYELYYLKNHVEWVYLYNDETMPNPSFVTYNCPKFLPGSYLIDSSGQSDDWNWGNDYDIYTPKYTGYRFYWKLIKIENLVLGYVNKAADFIVNNAILRYAFLVGFGAEVIMFVATLIKKIGEFRSSEED